MTIIISFEMISSWNKDHEIIPSEVNILNKISMNKKRKLDAMGNNAYKYWGKNWHRHIVTKGVA